MPGSPAAARRLVLDLANPDPAPPAYLRDEEQTASEAATESVDWTDGRRIRSSMTITGYQRTLQCSECTMTYEVVEADGTTRLVTETFPLRYVFRYELEHLLARAASASSRSTATTTGHRSQRSRWG